MRYDSEGALLIIVLIIVGALALNYLESGDIENRYASAMFARCVSEHPDWEEADCQRILRQIIWLGMTDEQVAKLQREIG